MYTVVYSIMVKVGKVQIKFIKTCPVCGLDFKTISIRQKTCSVFKRRCGYKFYNTVMGKAHCTIQLAVKSGKIKRQLCYCGQPAIAHHDDYDRPEDVLWLCKRHHHKRHWFINLRAVGLI